MKCLLILQILADSQVVGMIVHELACMAHYEKDMVQSFLHEKAPVKMVILIKNNMTH